MTRKTLEDLAPAKEELALEAEKAKDAVTLDAAGKAAVRRVIADDDDSGPTLTPAQVLAVQVELIRIGELEGPPRQVFGPETRAALTRAFDGDAWACLAALALLDRLRQMEPRHP